jgi:hypothetical protein
MISKPTIACSFLIRRQVNHPLSAQKVDKAYTQKMSSGGAALMAVQVLVDHGVPQKKIVFVTYFAGKMGLNRLTQVFPEVKVVVCKIVADYEERVSSSTLWPDYMLFKLSMERHELDLGASRLLCYSVDGFSISACAYVKTC